MASLHKDMQAATSAQQEMLKLEYLWACSRLGNSMHSETPRRLSQHLLAASSMVWTAARPAAPIAAHRSS